MTHNLQFSLGPFPERRQRRPIANHLSDLVYNYMELDGLPSTVMPLPAVTLTFDLLTPKSNQHIYEHL